MGLIDHPDRIKAPLLRVNGQLKETSWDEALRFISDELERTKTQAGPESIAAVVSGRLTNEELFLAGKFFKEAIGTDRVALAGNGAHKGLTEGLAQTLGVPASTGSIRELREADCILVIGVDPAETHPIIRNEVHLAIRKNRAQLIVIGNYEIGLSRNSQASPLLSQAISLVGKPGMEFTYLQGMTRAILKDGLENKGFIEQQTEGIEGFKEKLFSNAIEGLSESEKGDLEKAARAFARAKRGMILIGTGEWSQLSRKEIAVAASSLSLVAGHPSILVLQEKCNSQGATDQGISNGEEDVLKGLEEGKIKTLYVMGDDPLSKSSNPDRLKRALENLRLLVVHELFMTETAKLAHVVLPVASFAEKTGTYTSLERRVQKLNPFRPPAHGSRPDFDILLHLLRNLECATPGETPDAVFGEISRLNPYYQGVEPGEQWPKGLSHLCANGFPNGKAKLALVEGQRPLSTANEGYPLFLIQRPSLFQSGLLSLRSENLEMVRKKPVVEINPEDAEALGIGSGEMVWVSNPAGQSMKIEARISKRPVKGVVTAPWPCPLIEEGGVAAVKIEKLKERAA